MVGCKTRKNKKYNNKIIKNAVCVLKPDKNSNVYGIVRFKQFKHKLKIMYDIKGLSDGLHGFHIHEYGDLTDGCTSSCSHFNPFNKKHGGLNSSERHVGDLGNIISKNNIAKGIIYDKLTTLNHNDICCILGRCVVVHEDEDDLGLGNNEESKKTGNAGKRLACGVIGISK
tara:strand:+ start:1135 stop:1647 length:513 start_codon:yes stop_codon:yes gene_type:complete